LPLARSSATFSSCGVSSSRVAGSRRRAVSPVAASHGTDAEALAGALVAELERKPDYRPIEGNGAARAAAAISELI
jgi:hypothetical protein